MRHFLFLLALAREMERKAELFPPQHLWLRLRQQRQPHSRPQRSTACPCSSTSVNRHHLNTAAPPADLPVPSRPMSRCSSLQESEQHRVDRWRRRHCLSTRCWRPTCALSNNNSNHSRVRRSLLPGSPNNNSSSSAFNHINRHNHSRSNSNKEARRRSQRRSRGW